MKSTAASWTAATGWQGLSEATLADLVLFFGSRKLLADGERYRELKARFPQAQVMGCTTGGQIQGELVSDETIAALAIKFDKTRLRLAVVSIESPGESRASGTALGKELAANDLAGIFVLSDGLFVNGANLVKGLAEEVGAQVAISGGLAGDGSDFKETLVSGNCPPRARAVAALGLYGSDIQITHGCGGGWDVFGPKRRITRAEGNILYELDGERALDLYERYLGQDEAERLPGSALLFPLQVSDPKRPEFTVVRTVLAVDRQMRSMTFAADVPVGSVAQLMRGNLDRVAAGGADAALNARRACGQPSQVALLVSCIGRRLVLGQRITNEIEAAREVLGDATDCLGFYSYGEISPHPASGFCDLHNQTITITTLTEN